MSGNHKRAASPEAPWTDITARESLAEAFADLFGPNNDALVTAKKYMTPDYTQCVDGVVLDFEGFVKHLKTLQSTFRMVDFTFEKVVASGTTILDIHIVDAVKKGRVDNPDEGHSVPSYAWEQIERIDELTHLIEGDAEDRNLGSRINR
ncbi:MAG: hypothetical protein AAF636_21865 [Pseudomonadota bacterium]